MSNLLKNNLALLSLSGIDIILRIFNQIQIANYYGTSSQRDAYFLANALIIFLFTIHYRSIALFFLPKHTLYLRKHGREGLGHGFVWIYLLVISFFAIALILMLSGLVSTDLLPFKDSALLLKLAIILLTGFVFQTGVSLQTATYHSEKVFIVPGLHNIFTVLIIIFSVHFFHEKGIEVIAWGYLIGNLFFFGVLFLIRLKKFTQDIVWAYEIEKGKRFFQKVAPYILLAGMSLILHLIEPLFVLKESTGTISFLGYSYQIILILLTLISASILTTFYPRISDSHAQNDHLRLRYEVLNTIRITFIVCASIAGFVFLFGKEILSFVFVRGSFSEEDSLAIYKVLRWEMIAFVFGALNLLLNRFFYLKDNKKMLFRAAGISLLSYMLAAILFYYLFDYEGLGMALAIAFFAYFTVLILSTISQLKFQGKKLLLFFMEASTFITIAIILVLLVELSIKQFNLNNHTLIEALMYCVLLLVIFTLRFKKLFFRKLKK